MALSFNGLKVEIDADYVAEMARQFAVERLGSAAYTDGYVVHTTVNGPLQEAAQQAVIDGLKTYDWRHGWRGPEQQHPVTEEDTDESLSKRWQKALISMPVVAGLKPAIVTEITDGFATILLRDGQSSQLDWTGDLNRVRRYQTENRRSGRARDIGELLSVGDLIRVSEQPDGHHKLSQVPRVQGALVSMQPTDGSIKALVGGMGFVLSKFNRATQAERQPGSSFKPFLYATALENGIHPSTLINDAPVVVGNLPMTIFGDRKMTAGNFMAPPA